MAVGSVDDGKSTLIGRLLHDTGMVYEDQLEAAQRASRMPDGSLDFSLLTDGLAAEREQGITIDVAYRYFSTEQAQVHHRRYAGARAVHPEHGDRRVHRGRGADPHRRAARGAGAEPAARDHRLAAGDPAPGRVREQDGPGELGPGGLRAHPGGLQRLRGGPGVQGHRVHPRECGTRLQHRRAEHADALVRRPDGARVPGARAGWRRPESGRPAVPGAVRDPARPELPRLRRRGGERDREGGAGGDGPPRRAEEPGEGHRHLRWAAARGRDPAVRGGAPRGRGRREPRRHARGCRADPPGAPALRGPPGVDERASPGPPEDLPAQAHHPDRAGADRSGGVEEGHGDAGRGARPRASRSTTSGGWR